MKLKVIAIVVGTLLFFEVFVRFLVVSPAVIAYDPELGPMKAPLSHILRTYEGFNRYTNDQYGLNNDKLPSLTNKHRLLVLGDSFVEAKHVPREQNFVARLNALPNVLAYNAGYSGADPRSFPVLVRRFSPIIQPTQLVLCVNADDLTALHTIRLPKYDSPSGIKAWLQPLFAYSALATHLNWKYKQVFQDWVLSWQQHQHDELGAQHDDKYAKNWIEILNILKIYDIPIAVLVLPSLRYEDGHVRVVLDQREELLASLAQSQGLMVIRTEDYFIQAFKDTQDVAFGFMNSHLGTGHLNDKGHQMVADIISQVLRLNP